MNKATIVSGYFNPIHVGHLELFEIAKGIGDMLIVIVNSDLQRFLKGSKEFQLENERLEIVKAIKYVDWAMISIDTDGCSIPSLPFTWSGYGIRDWAITDDERAFGLLTTYYSSTSSQYHRIIEY